MVNKIEPIESDTPNSTHNLLVSPSANAGQHNFDPNNLPPGTEGFYNSAAFGQNESQFLSTMVSLEEEEQLKGLNQIKRSITE